MKRRLYHFYFLTISTVAVTLGGCASIVTPAPRVIAIVVPAMPPPVAVLPPAPEGTVVRPPYRDIAGPSGLQPQITAPTSKERDGASRMRNDDRRSSCETISI